MRVIFMGTPEFAAVSLRALAAEGFTVTCAVSQPDKPAGRGQKKQPTAVRAAAEELGIPVYQPAALKTGKFETRIRELRPDVLVVVAYGRLLPQEILDIPLLGCVNVHASLLPKYRGAAPIQRAIMHGERITGVATQRMAAELDAGDVYLSRETAICPRETAGELHDRLAVLGAELLVDTLRYLSAGRDAHGAPFTATPQDHSQATWAPPLTKEEGLIDWSMPAERICAIIRGVTPWPGAYTVWQGKRLKLFDAVPNDTDGIVFQCKDGTICAREVQPEGGRRMGAAEFLRGQR
jgi:methionyl-tRNA formyltransferase